MDIPVDSFAKLYSSLPGQPNNIMPPGIDPTPPYITLRVGSSGINAVKLCVYCFKSHKRQEADITYHFFLTD